MKRLADLDWDAVAERVVRPAPCPVLTIRPPGASAVDLRTTVI
jgi:hypothetical protein